MNYRVNGIRFSQDGQDTDVEVNQGRFLGFSTRKFRIKK